MHLETLNLSLNILCFFLRTAALLSKYQPYITKKKQKNPYLDFSFFLSLHCQFSQTLHFIVQLFILLLKFQSLFTDKGTLFSFWIQSALQFRDNFLATGFLFLRAKREGKSGCSWRTEQLLNQRMKEIDWELSTNQQRMLSWWWNW